MWRWLARITSVLAVGIWIVFLVGGLVIVRAAAVWIHLRVSG